MKLLLYRPIQLVTLVFAGLLLLVLSILGGLNWHDHQRLKTIQQAVDHTHAIQGAGLNLQRILLENLAGKAPVNREQLHSLDAELARLATPGNSLSTDTPDRLAQIRSLLVDTGQPPDVSLATALGLIPQIAYAETGAVARLLADANRNTDTEAQLASAALLVLPSLLVLAIWLLRWRIFNPINNLKELLSQLANGEFTPVPLQQVDPLLLPLLDNYNQMVLRLKELEQVHRSHAASLEAEVHAATQTLLQQQHHLARAERLAAVGELSAKLAHELRNPLAGMQLTLINLRQDLQDPDFVDRLDLVIAELERITHLLNSLLAQARHVPERPCLVDLAKEIRELLALLQYQAMPAIVLEADVPENLQCRLPEDQLRQALLNLVLNAIQALNGSMGKVRVRAEKQADLLQLSVCDDGPGFPEPLLTRGVKTFISRRESGIGLGLAMVSRFAREVGGKLELANREPHGACATLLLPWEEGDA